MVKVKYLKGSKTIKTQIFKSKELFVTDFIPITDLDYDSIEFEGICVNDILKLTNQL